MKIPTVVISAAKILKAANVEFAVLEEEPCCGSVMLRTGRTDEAHLNAQKVVSAIQKSGAKKIIVTCAGCLRTLREDFPKLGLEIPEVLHIVEVLQETIAGKKLKLKPETEGLKVTYHDPCHLSRALGIYDAPREVIMAMPDVVFVEMETSRETATCCGAGGGLRSYDPDLAKRIAADRVKNAQEVGAEIIATACPFCESNLRLGAKKINSSIRVADIVDLVAERLK